MDGSVEPPEFETPLEPPELEPPLPEPVADGSLPVGNDDPEVGSDGEVAEADEYPPEFESKASLGRTDEFAAIASAEPAVNELRTGWATTVVGKAIGAVKSEVGLAVSKARPSRASRVWKRSARLGAAQGRNPQLVTQSFGETPGTSASREESRRSVWVEGESINSFSGRQVYSFIFSRPNFASFDG